MFPPSSIQRISIDRSRFKAPGGGREESELGFAHGCARHFSGEIVELARPDRFRLRPQANRRTCAASPLPSAGSSRLTATCVEPDLYAFARGELGRILRFMNVSPFPRRAIRTRVLTASLFVELRDFLADRLQFTATFQNPEAIAETKRILHQHLKTVDP